MEENDFYFFDSHSKNFIEMAIAEDRVGILEDADAYGKNTGICGDTIEFFLIARNSRIERIKFITNGCINTRACANAAAVMAEGKTVVYAWNLTPQQLVDFLQTLPPESLHCAELAAGALYRALANLREVSRNPWKKSYQKKY